MIGNKERLSMLGNRRGKMKPVMTLKEYELLYRIVSAVGEKFSHGKGRSCLFYNVIGAAVINDVLRVKAMPLMGAAFISVNEREIVAYAGHEDGRVYSSEDKFHCWIETDDFYIDLTAPEYGVDMKHSVPKKMFQKFRRESLGHPNDIEKPGDFSFHPNIALSRHYLMNMMNSPQMHDFTEICKHWFKSSLKKELPTLTITDDLGKTTEFKLKPRCIESKW